MNLRSPELPPIIQMCDALSRNVPKIVETLVANCNAHGRRNFVKVTANFPEPCRFVLEAFREIYRYDAVTRKQGMSPEERLAFHQEHSKPVTEKLVHGELIRSSGYRSLVQTSTVSQPPV